MRCGAETHWTKIMIFSFVSSLTALHFFSPVCPLYSANGFSQKKTVCGTQQCCFFCFCFFGFGGCLQGAASQSSTSEIPQFQAALRTTWCIDTATCCPGIGWIFVIVRVSQIHISIERNLCERCDIFTRLPSFSGVQNKYLLMKYCTI